MSAFHNIKTVFKRELAGYFNNPLAYVFIFIFVLLAMVFAFVIGGFLERGDATLTWSFFEFHPWLFMILGPAVGMRLWSEEHRLGTIELLLTMPISPWQAIVGKFLAACVVLFTALLLTFPIVITLIYLSKWNFDIGVVLSGYLGSFFVAATTVAITCVVSAVTRSQVACLVVSVCICFILTMTGFWMFLDFFKQSGMGFFEQVFSSISLMSHANAMNRGLLRLETFVYFIGMITFCLFTTSVIIRSKRS